MKDFRFVRLLFIALLAAVLPACTRINENEGTTVLSVELNHKQYLLTPPQTVQLQATVKYSGTQTLSVGVPTMNPVSQNKQVTWSSDHPEIATVNDSGLVTAVSQGEATVTAKAGGKEASCYIIVEEEPAYSSDDPTSDDPSSDDPSSDDPSSDDPSSDDPSSDDPSSDDPSSSPDPSLHSAVDLGLSVKWASFNIGSADISYLGSLYSFGDVKPRDENATGAYLDYPWGTYDPSRYRFNYTKYTPEDGLQKLEPADDAATYNWGEDWWTPTKSEWAEFRDNTLVRFYNNNYFYGAVYTSLINGKSIILPALPKKNAPELWKQYMSSTPYNVGDMREAYMFTQSFKYLSSSYDYDNRTHMYSVRAVTDGPVNEAELTPVSADIEPGGTLKLSASGFGSGIYWRSTDPNVAVVSQDGTVTAKDLGDVLIYATDGTEAFAGSMITVISKEQTVDLGLSVNWGGWNLGASGSDEVGDYFAWGETEPDPDGWYDGTHYKYCSSTSDNDRYLVFSKYFVSSSPVYLDTEDDAAVRQWGSGWRMPSEAEILELIDKTTRSLAYMHGLRGIRVIGPSGKSIFMPTASEMSKDEISTYGFIGLDNFVFWRHFNAGSYWSNCLYPESMESRHSYCLSLSVELLDQTDNGAKMEFNTRVTGLPIRAVHDK